MVSWLQVLFGPHATLTICVEKHPPSLHGREASSPLDATRGGRIPCGLLVSFPAGPHRLTARKTTSYGSVPNDSVNGPALAPERRPVGGDGHGGRGRGLHRALDRRRTSRFSHHLRGPFSDR